jgi:predicted nuclease with TOPRIM domain
VARIQGLLAAYFFVLMAQTLLERELRQAMARAGLKSMPMYPENRECARPTTHRVIEIFSTIQRHEVRVEEADAQIMVTELTETQRTIIRMMGLNPKTYGY